MSALERLYERLFLILFLIIIAAAIESFLTLKIYKGVWGT